MSCPSDVFIPDPVHPRLSQKNLNICLFFSATVCKPNYIACLTTVLNSFPFILADMLLSTCLTLFSTRSNLLALASSPLFHTLCCAEPHHSTWVSLIHIHVFCLAVTNLWLIPLLSRADLHLSRFSSTCSLLSLQITMSSANSSPRRFLSNLICQSVHHQSKREGAQWRSLMQTHLHLELLCHTYSTPPHGLTAPIHVLHHSNTLLCHSRLIHTIPQLLSQHPVIRFL
ncbi:hypothetical protein EXN66_Car017062 [Channa argus]|uniref:Uncharacterized protein n=1 Tax=Channa argus TaxID=215402 RepID=A0A6G1QG09_CHAAH|nr:hypothetical protein EXN66_Car017062 [Channa argus]